MINFGVSGVEIMVSSCCDGLLEFPAECDLEASSPHLITAQILSSQRGFGQGSDRAAYAKKTSVYFLEIVRFAHGSQSWLDDFR